MIYKNLNKITFANNGYSSLLGQCRLTKITALFSTCDLFAKLGAKPRNKPEPTRYNQFKPKINNMFKFLKKGREVNNLAKSFNGMYLMLQEIVPQIEQNPNKAEFRESILVLAYVATKGVHDRIDENEISMMHKIMIPTIQRGFITVTYAYQQTVGKLLTIVNLLEMDEIVNEVMDKGPAFFELENNLPPKVVNNI